MFTAANGCVGKREVVGARFSGNRHATFFCLSDEIHGLRAADVLAVDISQAGLDLARQRALAQGSQIETMSVDLEVDSLPEGPFDLITCFNYRQRNLFPSIRERLKIGGSLLAEIAIVTNLERHAHPSLRYLGQLGELRQDCAPLEILYYQEGWFDDRASARVLARRVA